MVVRITEETGDKNWFLVGLSAFTGLISITSFLMFIRPYTEVVDEQEAN